CYAIDTTALRRDGLLKPGTRSGSLALGLSSSGTPATTDYAIDVGRTGGTLRPSYRFTRTGGEVDYPLRLGTTRGHFGGGRGGVAVVVRVSAVGERRAVRPAGTEVVPLRAVLRVPALPRPDLPVHTGERQESVRSRPRRLRSRATRRPGTDVVA